MPKAALFSHDGVPGDVLHLALDGTSIEVAKLYARGRNHREVAISQKEQIAGVIQDGGDIGGDKILVFPQPNHRRRAIARGHDLVRLFAADHGDGKDAAKFVDGLAYRLFERRT